MGTILKFLGSDHRACDDLFASAEMAVAQNNWARARSQFERFQAAMVRHLAREENILFPAFEAQTGNRMGPTRIMRMEHQQIRDLVIGVAYQVVPMVQITPPYPLLLGVLFIGGFAVSVVSGMLYKIVPFLA